MTKWLALLVALLFPIVACAQEDERPDGTFATSGSSCTTSDAHTTLDDDVDGAGTDYCTASTCSGSSASEPSFVLTFNTPSGNPSTATDAQQYAVRLKKCDGTGNDPTCELTYCCNGGSVVTTGASQTISNASAHIVTQNFTFNTASCAADGSDTEICLACFRPSGSPSGRRSVDVESVEWRATLASGATRRIIITGEALENK